MIDIVDFTPQGMQVYDTQTQRAANILGVQLGSLEYQPDLGIDLRYFLTENISFQNDSFRAYLVQALASGGINVASMVEVLRALSTDYNINLSPEDNSTGLIAR
jgi:hypothetical protein